MKKHIIFLIFTTLISYNLALGQKIQEVTNLIGKSKEMAHSFLRNKDYELKSEIGFNEEAWINDGIFDKSHIYFKRGNSSLDVITEIAYCFNDKSVFNQYLLYKESMTKKCKQCPRDMFEINGYIGSIFSAANQLTNKDLKMIDVIGEKYKYVLYIVATAKMSDYLKSKQIKF